jgi:hypothetical protein
VMSQVHMLTGLYQHMPKQASTSWDLQRFKLKYWRHGTPDFLAVLEVKGAPIFCGKLSVVGIIGCNFHAWDVVDV